MCRYGFNRMRLHMITLWVVAENEIARHVRNETGRDAGRIPAERTAEYLRRRRAHAPCASAEIHMDAREWKCLGQQPFRRV